MNETALKDRLKLIAKNKGVLLLYGLLNSINRVEMPGYALDVTCA